jgi:hypothetical protein
MYKSDQIELLVIHELFCLFFMFKISSSKEFLNILRPCPLLSCLPFPLPFFSLSVIPEYNDDSGQTRSNITLLIFTL